MRPRNQARHAIHSHLSTSLSPFCTRDFHYFVFRSSTLKHTYPKTLLYFVPSLYIHILSLPALIFSFLQFDPFKFIILASVISKRQKKVYFFGGKMEEVSESMSNLNIVENSNNNNNNTSNNQKKNRIQVSNTKQPLFFYVNLAKRYLKNHDEVELSGLGMAIATVVTVAEILKNNGLAVEKKIITSTVDMKDESRPRPIQKAKIEILLTKSHNFEELMDAATEENHLEEAHENS